MKERFYIELCIKGKGFQKVLAKRHGNQMCLVPGHIIGKENLPLIQRVESVRKADRRGWVLADIDENCMPEKWKGMIVFKVI
jgi:hypothetical protein